MIIRPLPEGGLFRFAGMVSMSIKVLAYQLGVWVWESGGTGFCGSADRRWGAVAPCESCEVRLTSQLSRGTPDPWTPPPVTTAGPRRPTLLNYGLHRTTA